MTAPRPPGVWQSGTPTVIGPAYLDGFAPPATTNPALVYLSRISATSRVTNTKYLGTIAELLSRGRATIQTFPWGSLRYEHIAAVQAHYAGRRAAKSANHAVSVLRRVLKEAWRMGQLDAETFARATDIEPVKGKVLPKGRHISQGEIRAMIFECLGSSEPTRGARDAAIISILYGTGIRREELSVVELRDLDLEAGTITIRRGKGNEARVVYMPAGTRALVWSWLKVRGLEPGALIVGIAAHGDTLRPGMKHMHPESIREAVQRVAAAIGTERLTPHDFRRTMISDLFDAGEDLAAIMRQTGHRSHAACLRYDRRGDYVQARAASKIHVPYRKPRRRGRA